MHMQQHMNLREFIDSTRAVCGKATEGPWGVDSGMKYTETAKGTRFQHIMGAWGKAICNTSHFDEVRLDGGLLSEQRHGKMEDAAFIATARTALPLALEMLEIAEKALEHVKGRSIGCTPCRITIENEEGEHFMEIAKKALAAMVKRLER